MFGLLITFSCFAGICIAAIRRPAKGLIGFYLLDPLYNWRWAIPSVIDYQKLLVGSLAIGFFVSGFKVTKDATTPTTSHCALFRYPHTKMHSYFHDELDISYTRVSDPIVGYVLGHGDNCSDGDRTSTLNRLCSKLKAWLEGKPIENRLAQRLGLQPVRSYVKRTHRPCLALYL